MRRTFAAGVLAAVAVAVVLRLVHGPGALGYDALWSLAWGEDILSGRAPGLEATFAPTPHPLSNLLGALLMAAGPGFATTALLACAWLALGALAVVVARLGAALFSWPVGIVAAAAVATRAVLVLETAQAYVDVAFLALAVAAADREVRRPRSGLAVPILIAVAGLLRPEAWALGAAYVVYRRRDARVLVPLLAAAPVLWALMDLWATGDPLHSLHGTRELAETLDRPRDSASVLSVAPTALREIVQEPLLWVALAGAAAGLVARPRASALPGALLGLGLAGFVVLGLAGLPLLGRYLLLPACMLLVFAGLAVFGWIGAREHAGWWRWGGAAAAAVVLAGVPGDVEDFRAARDYGQLRAAVQDDLRAAVRAAAESGCAAVEAPDRRSAAVVALYRAPGAAGRAVIGYADPEVLRSFALGDPAPLPAPRGARRIHDGRYWTADASGC